MKSFILHPDGFAAADKHQHRQTATMSQRHHFFINRIIKTYQKL